MLLLLEKLSPTERAAYVLREAFDYPYRKIADILRMKEANVRQVVTRARVHVSGRRRAPVRSTSQHRLFNAFVAASRTGDLTRLERLLVSDVISNSEKRCGHSREAFDNLRYKLTATRPDSGQECAPYGSRAYSARASLRTGMSGSAFFQSVKRSS